MTRPMTRRPTAPKATTPRRNATASLPIRQTPGAFDASPPRAAAWLLAAMLCLAPATASSQDGITKFGTNALLSNTTGDANSAFGDSVLLSNTTGNANTASGWGALRSNTTGSYNTASGRAAVFSNTTGNSNTASGYDALFSNTTGNDNTANGRDALGSNTTGNNNTASGVSALFANTTGINNTAVGFDALKALTTGVRNLALGASAGWLTTSGSNNIYVGNPGIVGRDDQSIRIGHHILQRKTFIAGISGTPLTGATVVIRSTGQLGVIASSARYKTDVVPLGAQAAALAEKLARLEPVSYRYTSDPGATHYGLIAEEVEKVMPELVVRDEQSRPETVQYIELIPLLLQQWQAQRAEIERQRAENLRQNATIERQQSTIERLEKQNATVALQNARLEQLEARLAQLDRPHPVRSVALEAAAR